MTPNLLYWTQGGPVVNFGDYVTQYLLERLGVEFNHFDDTQPDDGAPVLFGVGTMLSDYWLNWRAKDRTVIVWGSGYGGADISLPIRADVRAVRGPLTREKLQLPESLPLGDPALLLPRFFPVLSKAHGPCVYLPHWENAQLRGQAEVDAFAHRLGARRVLSPIISTEDFSELIRSIATSEFVFTASLHGAIVAHAYGVPWAPCLMPGEQFNLHPKWEDFLLFLGIDPESLHLDREHLNNPHRWWDRHVACSSTPDLEPLMEAFPFRANVTHLPLSVGTR